MKAFITHSAFLLSIPLFGTRVFAAEPLPAIDIKTVVQTEAVAQEAYIWGYPYVKFERTRKLLTTTPGFGHAPLNHFFHANRLLTAQDRDMANPLPDTLYSSAFLDLRKQPMVLELPKIKNRFYTLQFMDAANNNVGLVSSRTRSEGGGKFFITGPQYIGTTPSGFEHIRSTTNFLWLIGHIAAPSSDEVKEASALLKKYKLRPYDVYLGKVKPPRTPILGENADPDLDPRKISQAGLRFYDELGQALKVNEPSDLDAPMMERFRSVEIGTGLKTSRKSEVRELREAYERAIASGEIAISQTLKKELLKKNTNWSYITRGDNLGKSYSLRAAMSKVYFGEANSAEAMHFVTYVDKNKVRLNGNETYLLKLPKDKMPPVQSFWSVAVYNFNDKFLVQNNMQRFSLGSYSKNVQLNADGSLDIYISANEPLGHTSNWIPAPRGPFYVMMNMYHPSAEAISGKYILPSLLKVTPPPGLSMN